VALVKLELVLHLTLRGKLGVEEEELGEATSSKLEEEDEGEVVQLAGVKLRRSSGEAPVR
jgi:hypothetical protein